MVIAIILALVSPALLIAAAVELRDERDSVRLSPAEMRRYLELGS